MEKDKFISLALDNLMRDLEKEYPTFSILDFIDDIVNLSLMAYVLKSPNREDAKGFLKDKLHCMFQKMKEMEIIHDDR